jgi:hypothetical protein
MGHCIHSAIRRTSGLHAEGRGSVVSLLSYFLLLDILLLVLGLIA